MKNYQPLRHSKTPKNHHNSGEKLKTNIQSFKRKLEKSNILQIKHQKHKTKLKTNNLSTTHTNKTSKTSKNIKTTNPVTFKNSKKNHFYQPLDKTFNVKKPSFQIKTIKPPKTPKTKPHNSKKLATAPTPPPKGHPKSNKTQKGYSKKFYYINNQSLQNKISKILNNNKFKSPKLLRLKKNPHFIRK